TVAVEIDPDGTVAMLVISPVAKSSVKASLINCSVLNMGIPLFLRPDADTAHKILFYHEGLKNMKFN
ncbi:MAG: hypothetical protein U9P37_03950, partial [Pseudomonadota bacterium]|nr:hypothetical protein [Pseudomonadota bacterium]